MPNGNSTTEISAAATTTTTTDVVNMNSTTLLRADSRDQFYLNTPKEILSPSSDSTDSAVFTYNNQNATSNQNNTTATSGNCTESATANNLVKPNGVVDTNCDQPSEVKTGATSVTEFFLENEPSISRTGSNSNLKRSPSPNSYDSLPGQNKKFRDSNVSVYKNDSKIT